MDSEPYEMTETEDSGICESSLFVWMGRNATYLRQAAFSNHRRSLQVGYMYVMRDHSVPVADGVILQAQLDELNGKSKPRPPDIPWSLSFFRHPCPRAHRPVTSPATEKYFYSGDDFALIYREGRCTRCGRVGRSSSGCAIEVAKYPLNRV